MAMQVNEELLNIYTKSRGIRHAIQEAVKTNQNTKLLVMCDLELSVKAKTICPDVNLRTLHRKLSLAIINEDYQLCEQVKYLIKEYE
jgi:hypothetical protein